MTGMDSDDDAPERASLAFVELPGEASRAKLIAALANVLKQAGWERLVTHPILLPKSSYFPDRWNRSARGAYRLVRRLMVYAGLEGDASVHVFKTTEADTHVDADGDPYPLGPEHALATFHGETDDGYVFGVDVQQLGDDETLVGAMCHEVAHAFRCTHELEVSAHDVEEQLTDLTTIYLGFGVLTANNAHRVRTGGGVSGAMAWSQVSHASAGYLGPGELTFLLAVQAVVRAHEGKATKETARIAKHLEANQAAMFSTAVEDLLPRRETLVAELGIPSDEATWPANEPRERFLRTLDMAREGELDGDAPKALHGRSGNRGDVVFRVKHTRTVAVATSLASLSILAALLMRVQDTTALCGLVACGAVAGIVVGRKIVYYECSDSTCEARLRREETQCPRCGGAVRGTIASAGRRLDALEELDEGTFRSLD